MKKIISICLMLTMLFTNMAMTISYAEEYSVTIKASEVTKSGEGGTSVAGTDWYRNGSTSFPAWNTTRFEMTNGSWGRYSVNAPCSGVYAVSVKVGNNNQESIIAVETESGYRASYAVPKNDNLWGLEYSDIGYVYLEEGENILKVTDEGPGYYVFHNATFKKVDDSFMSQVGISAIKIDPKTDYDDFWVYHGGYTDAPHIDNNGLTAVQKEWQSYTVNVPIDGTYEITVNAATYNETKIQFETNGYVTEMALPKTTTATTFGDYSDAYIYLKAGQTKIWVRNTGGAFYSYKKITLSYSDNTKLGINRVFIPAECYTNDVISSEKVTYNHYNSIKWANEETLNYEFEILSDGYYTFNQTAVIPQYVKQTVSIDGEEISQLHMSDDGYLMNFGGIYDTVTKQISDEIYLEAGTHTMSVYHSNPSLTSYVTGFEFTGLTEEDSALIDFNSAKDEDDIKVALLKYSNVLGVNPNVDFKDIICPEYSYLGLIGSFETLEDVINTYNSVKENPLVEYTQDENSLVATIKLVDSIEVGDTVILASYRGMKLASVDYDVVYDDNITLTLDNYVKEDGDIFRIFVWDSMNGMTPLEVKVHNSNVYRNFYVSPNGSDENSGMKHYPFKTLSKALDAVSVANDDMTGDIVVNVDGGVYDFTSTVNITDEHSGKNGYDVVIKGVDEDDKPIFSGGEKIEKWTNLTGTPIYFADVKTSETRNLYINDYPATLARSKYVYRAAAPIIPETPINSYHITDGISISKANFPTSLDTETDADLTLVYNNLWANQRVLVDEVVYDDRNANLYMTQPYYNSASYWTNTSTSTHFDKYFYIENAFSLLDEPGEFYFNKNAKRVFYYPYPDEDLTTAQAYVGVSDKILNLCGADKNNKLKNFIIDSVEFKYGTYNDINTYGAVFNQSDNVRIGTEGWYRDAMMKSQVSVNNADNVIIQNCDFSCLGSNALNLDEAVTNSKVSGNSFSDISGTGIVVGSFLHGNSMGEDKERCGNIEIDNNILRRCAQEYLGLSAINAYYVHDTNIHHNDIKDMPYSGITLGWGWGNSGDVEECKNNTISHNRIENVMQEMSDGAHIYTLGAMANTKINNNYLISSGDTRGGIYLDEGSAHIRVENNVVEKCSQWLFARSGAKLSDIIAVNNFSDVPDSDYDTENVTLSGTTVVSDANWSGQAKNIVDAVGVGDGRNISEVDFYPEWRKMRMNDIAESEFLSDDINSVWIKASDYTNFSVQAAVTPEVYADNSIGNTRSGDWIEYTVKIPSEANYRITAACGGLTATTAPKAELYIDTLFGFSATSSADVPTYSDSIYISGLADLGTHKLSAGSHRIRIKIVDASLILRGIKLENVDVVVENDTNYDDGQ